MGICILQILSNCTFAVVAEHCIMTGKRCFVRNGNLRSKTVVPSKKPVQVESIELFSKRAQAMLLFFSHEDRVEPRDRGSDHFAGRIDRVLPLVLDVVFLGELVVRAGVLLELIQSLPTQTVTVH